MLEFIIGLAIGFAGGLVVAFLVWKNNKARMQALGQTFLDKVK